MCTCPIPLTREWKYRPGVRYTEVVPCGKCHECLAKAQNEFAALAVLEAKKAKSMYFVTFTYANHHCPVMCSQKVAEDPFQFFLEGKDRLSVIPEMIRERSGRDGKLVKYLEQIERDDAVFVPSLRREDLKLFLKKTRQAYLRKYDKPLVFRYAGFGEYG